MSEYRLTFGSQYAHTRHPTLAVAHPDGWLTIVAPDERAARRVAVQLLDAAWSFLYGPDEYADAWEEHFPRGQLARVGLCSRCDRLTWGAEYDESSLCQRCLWGEP